MSFTSDSTASCGPECAFLPRTLRTLDPAEGLMCKKTLLPSTHIDTYTKCKITKKNLNQNAHGIQLNVLLLAGDNEVQTKINKFFKYEIKFNFQPATERGGKWLNMMSLYY